MLMNSLQTNEVSRMQKKIKYVLICPVCGNVLNIKLKPQDNKCPHCKTLFKYKEALKQKAD